MPELPDVDVYVERLNERIGGRVLEDIRVSTPFLVRSFDPPLSDANGRCVTKVSRLGKRIVFELDDDYALVLHLMIAGRLHWRSEKVTLKGKQQLAAFDFDAFSLFCLQSFPYKIEPFTG